MLWGMACLMLVIHILTLIVSARLCVFEGRVVASAEQMFSSGTESSVRVRVWNSETMRTESTFDESLDDQKLLAIVFAPNVRTSIHLPRG